MATIVRWNPWRDFESVQRRMRRMFDELDLTPATFPAANVYETEGELVIEVEAPGFEESQVDIEITDHTLVVKGEREEEKEQKEKTFWLHERLENTFERRFELPLAADTDKVAASFEKGVLSVHVPKKAEASPRKIPIGA
jgi:HSP20 family protein